MLAATFGTGQVVYSILWFALFVVEIWLMLSIFVDIFRSHDLRGWAKAAWIVFILAIPLIGILAYLIFRGDKMRAHQRAAAGDIRTSDDDHRRRSAHDVVDTLHRLADLRDRGEISAEEYRRLRDEILSEP
jgi:uncharacterized protein with PQ loop repeat